MPGSCQHGCNHTVHEKSSKASAYILTHLFFFWHFSLSDQKAMFWTKIWQQHYLSLRADRFFPLRR